MIICMDLMNAQWITFDAFTVFAGRKFGARMLDTLRGKV